MKDQLIGSKEMPLRKWIFGWYLLSGLQQTYLLPYPKNNEQRGKCNWKCLSLQRM